MAWTPISEPLEDDEEDVPVVTDVLDRLVELLELETVFDDSELVDVDRVDMELDDELLELTDVALVTVESDEVDLLVALVAVESEDVDRVVADESEDVDRLLSEERLVGVFEDSEVAVETLVAVDRESEETLDSDSLEREDKLESVDDAILHPAA